jgi:hypothetical protein
MGRIKILILFFIFAAVNTELLSAASVNSGRGPESVTVKDSLRESQILYNGRIWRNLYYMVNGDQFLFSKDFLPGTVTVRTITFTDVKLKYDIFKDELLTPSQTGGILQLNRELVDSFSLSYMNSTYRFIRIKADSTDNESGYFNIIYRGKIALYRKFIKKVDKLSVNGEGDKFYEFSRLYLVIYNTLYPVTGKGDLLNLLKDHKEMIRSYIKNSKIKIIDKEPESFIPVLRYYESISH